MYYISIDETPQALQTNEKLFTNLEFIYRINYNFLNNSGVGVVHARWGGICAEQHAFWFLLVVLAHQMTICDQSLASDILFVWHLQLSMKVCFNMYN